MTSWKDKVFDDIWKYLVGAAAGGTVFGLLLEKAAQLPMAFWYCSLILILLFFSFATYWSYPQLIPKFYKRKTYSYWIKIKNCLDEYHNEPDLTEKQKVKLNKRYISIRDKLNVITSAYHLEIQAYLKVKYESRGSRSGDLSFNNFKDCFYPISLSTWSSKVRRKVPQELDCFDELAREITILKVDQKP